MNAPDMSASSAHVAAASPDSADRTRLQRLADEHAALRRVATLVARGASPADVFTAVAAEVGLLLGADNAGVGRFDEDGGSVVVVGSVGGDPAKLPVGTRIRLRDYLALATVWRTGRSARVDEDLWSTRPDRVADRLREMGIRSIVASPIVVDGHLWGVMTVSSGHGAFPSDTEARMGHFTELAATAIANADSQQELRVLADTQAALRRVATLVARGEPPEAVFAATTHEALRRFGGGTARMIRYELDSSATLLSNEGTVGPHVRVGQRWEGYPPDGLTATVFRTGEPARVDDYGEIPGGEPYLREGIRSAIAVPIHVNGRLWGMIAVGSGRPLPPQAEQRMQEFTDLVATAVANAQNRAELIASRARIVTAADEVRRRIERDLHDGAQQRLLALALTLRSLAASPEALGQIRDEITDAAAGLIDAVDELREMSRGIHPAILSEAGLPPALRALGRRCGVPVDMDMRIDRRLPEQVEVGAYYVVSEMLTNAVKHAHASRVVVDAEAAPGVLRLCVRDDGIGGADPQRGSGLVGLKDRVEALGGTFDMRSPAGGGTTLACDLPV